MISLNVKIVSCSLVYEGSQVSLFIYCTIKGVHTLHHYTHFYKSKNYTNIKFEYI